MKIAPRRVATAEEIGRLVASWRHQVATGVGLAGFLLILGLMFKPL